MAKVSLNGWAVEMKKKMGFIEFGKKKKGGGSAPIVLLYPHNRMRRFSRGAANETQ